MKQLTFSFLCLLLGSVLVCTSFVMAAEPAAAEGIVQEETKGAQEAILAPMATSKPSAPILPLPDETKPSEEAWTTVTATAYCPCEKCCGVWAENRPNGIVYTASGAIAQEGVTIAADWDVYPPGTVLQVEGLGEYIVQDRGGAIKGLKIDVYFEDHDDALQFGRQEVRIRVVKAVTE